MAGINGKSGSRVDPFFGGADPIIVNMLAQAAEKITANTMSMRRELLNKLLDPRRSIEDECGYPRDVRQVGPWEYQDLYDRDPIANRVVEVMVKESWQTQPQVYEDEDPDKTTLFEEGWDGLVKHVRGERSWHGDEQGNPIIEALIRADILSGVGSYGVLLLGIDDGLPLGMPAPGVDLGLEEPATVKNLALPGERDTQGKWQPRVRPVGNLTVNELFGDPKRQGTDAQYYDWSSSYAASDGQVEALPRREGTKLRYIRCFSEAQAQVIQYESNQRSPRFGKPVRYAVTLNDPREQAGGVGLVISTVYVHWSRIVHLADGLRSSEVHGTPRMRPVLERLLDLRKLYGASPEGYWKACIAALSLETHPQLGGDVVVDQSALRDQLEQFQNGLQRMLLTTGMSAKMLTPTIVDPSPHIDKQLEAICVQLGIPVRVFKGSERGELASGQDDQAWNDRLRLRQNSHITPRVIAPFVDRCIALGCLPEPEESYHVYWPDLTSQTGQEKATIASVRTQALVAYVGGGVDALIQPQDYLTKILGLEEDEVESILEAVEQAALEEEQRRAEQGLPSPGEGGQPPEGGPPGNGPGQLPGPPQNAPEAEAGDKPAPAGNANPEGCNQHTGPSCGGGGGEGGGDDGPEVSAASGKSATKETLSAVYQQAAQGTMGLDKIKEFATGLSSKPKAELLELASTVDVFAPPSISKGKLVEQMRASLERRHERSSRTGGAYNAEQDQDDGDAQDQTAPRTNSAPLREKVSKVIRHGKDEKGFYSVVEETRVIEPGGDQ